MSAFVAGAGALLLLAAALLLWSDRRRPRGADRDDPNLGWLEQRRRELADSGDPRLLDEAALRLLEDGAAAGVRPASPGPRGGRRLAALLLLLALPASALLYYRLGALEDVLIYRQLDALSEQDPAGLERLTARVQARSEARPDNLYYLDLLGQLQLGSEDAAQAVDTFRRLAERAPESARAQAQAAQAMFLAAGRRLEPEAQLLAERALALDPQEGMALGLLGMASFEAQQYAAAVTYWERLQALEAPGSESHRMLEDVLRLARERAGLDVAEASPVAGAAATGDGSDAPAAGVTVSLALPEAAAASPDAVVFVFARPRGAAGGMPLAVRRLRAADLPLTLRLSDADSMAGALLSEAGEVVVSAQLSRNGQPGAANALFRGESPPVTPDVGGEAVAIRLQRVGSS